MSTLDVTNLKSKLALTPTKFYDKDDKEIGTLCRAWVNFNGTGTVAIRASFNVTSITDNGTGDYTVNFTTAMPDANYCVNGIVQRNIDVGSDGCFASIKLSSTYNSLLITSARVQATDAVGNVQDPLVYCVAIFR